MAPAGPRRPGSYPLAHARLGRPAHARDADLRDALAAASLERPHRVGATRGRPACAGDRGVGAVVRSGGGTARSAAGRGLRAPRVRRTRLRGREGAHREPSRLPHHRQSLLARRAPCTGGAARRDPQPARPPAQRAVPGRPPRLDAEAVHHVGALWDTPRSRTTWRGSATTRPFRTGGAGRTSGSMRPARSGCSCGTAFARWTSCSPCRTSIRSGSGARASRAAGRGALGAARPGVAGRRSGRVAAPGQLPAGRVARGRAARARGRLRRAGRALRREPRLTAPMRTRAGSAMAAEGRPRERGPVAERHTGGRGSPRSADGGRAEHGGHDAAGRAAARRV